MEKARYNTELYSNLKAPLNNVKPSNFWGSHHTDQSFFCVIQKKRARKRAVLCPKGEISTLWARNTVILCPKVNLLDNYLVAGLENFSRSQFPYVFPLGELPVVTIHITPSIPRLNTYEWHIRMLLRW